LAVGVSTNVSASSFQKGCFPTSYRPSHHTLNRFTSIYRCEALCRFSL